MVLKLKKMEVVEDVIKSRTYPIIYNRVVDAIHSMVDFQLKGIEMSDLEEAELGERITDKYVDSMAPRWSAVGVNAAQVIAENITQSSLSSHRMAGVTKGASGLDRIKEIMNLKNKADIVRVITTPVRGIPRSRLMIDELANTMVSVVFHDLVDRYEIVDVRPQWYDLFMFVASIPPQVMSNRWLRVYIDESTLYKYRISMPSLYSTILAGIEKSTIAMLYPPAGAVQEMYIDIHAGSLLPDDNSALYMALATIASTIISGVSSVSNSSPAGVNMLQDLEIIPRNDGIFEIRSKAPEFVPPTAWSHMLNMMVPEVEILSATGRVFRSSLPEYQDHERLRHIILEIPNNYESLVKHMTINDDGTVDITFKKEMTEEYPFLEHVIMEDRTFVSEKVAKDFLLLGIADFTNYWYIECICSRAQDLYALEEVDSTRTYTTSSLNIMESLGYLAMRNMMYQEFRANININSTHVSLIIDNMTLYREPVSFRRQSIVNDKSEFLSYTTFEDIPKYITQSGFTGEVDHMKSISAHVLTGSMIEVGQGGPDRMFAENEYIRKRKIARSQ